MEEKGREKEKGKGIGNDPMSETEVVVPAHGFGNYF
jgi:hypothetical protein